MRRTALFSMSLVALMLFSGCGNSSTNTQAANGSSPVTENVLPNHPDEEASEVPSVDGNLDAVNDESIEVNTSRPERPETADLDVMVEQIEVTLPFNLVDVPSMPFTTYLFNEFEVEVLTDPKPGIRTVQKNEQGHMSIEVTMYSKDENAETIQASFDEYVKSQGGRIEDFFSRTWAVNSTLIDQGDHADVFFLLEHDGQYLLMKQSFTWSLADAFAPVVQGFEEQWQWDDGTFLIPRPDA